MSSRSAERLIRSNLKVLRGDNISAIRNRRNETASGAHNDKSLGDTKLSDFLSRKKSGQNSPEAGLLLRKAIPANSCQSLNYLVMQYLFHKKNKVSFDPVSALSNFIVPRSAEAEAEAEAEADAEAETSIFKEPIAVEGHSEEGQGGIKKSKGEVTVSRGSGQSGLASYRLEMLKMKSARRPSNVSNEASQPEQEQVVSKEAPQHEQVVSEDAPQTKPKSLDP